MTMSREYEDKPQIGREYLQQILLIEDSYLKYTNRTFNSTRRKEITQFKNRQKKKKRNLKRHVTREDIQMENKHVKICSVLFIIRELQTTMRHHHKLIRIANI